jgi:hypothetical protein
VIFKPNSMRRLPSHLDYLKGLVAGVTEQMVLSEAFLSHLEMVFAVPTENLPSFYD